MSRSKVVPKSRVSKVKAFRNSLQVMLKHVCGNILSARHMLAHRRRSARAIRGCTFDIVTVVCSQDLSMLRMQARSLALYLDRDFSGSIVVVVNDVLPNKLIVQIKKTILPEYAHWRLQVVLVPIQDLGHGLDASNGWKIQQACKLAVATYMENPFYVVLDSKNHFVRHVRVSDFVTVGGLGRQKLDADMPTLGAHAQVCARFLGLDPQDVKPCWPMTPFVFHTSTVRNLVAKVEQQEKCSIFSTFRRVRFLSEFLLYKAYLRIVELNGSPAPYEEGPMLSRTVWSGQCTSSAIADAETDSRILVFGVHRDALDGLDVNERLALNRFWRGRGLLSPATRSDQVTAIQEGCTPAMAAKLAIAQ